MPDLMNLRTFNRSSKPNSAVFAPVGISIAADVDQTSPVFDCNSATLFEVCRNVLSKLERVSCVAENADSRRLAFVAQTKLLRFKDDIDVEVVDLGENRSSLVIYSRSRIGYSDLGTNRKRIEHWIEALDNHFNRG